MYEDHIDHRDEFEIIAVHDSSVKSFAELDEKLVKIRERLWNGRDLPFTVLLDLDSKTEDAYGIDRHPTSILIGPDGNIVGHVGVEAFEKKLTPLPAVAYLERARDRTFNVAWHLDSKVKISDLASYLSMRIGPEIELDTAGLDDTGLSADSPLPIAIAATGHSSRGLELLILEPLGLQLQPNKLDPTKLSLTKITNPAGRESFAESEDLDRRNATVRELLKSGIDSASKDKADEDKADEDNADEKTASDDASNARNIVRIEERSLFETIVLIERELGIPTAVDTSALANGTISADLKINGTLDTQQHWKSLRALLEENNLRASVKFGVLFIMPSEKSNAGSNGD